MSGIKGFSTPPVRVSQMRQILEAGGFANWITGLKKESEERAKALEIKRRKMLRLGNIVVDHARQPRKYHTLFIVFLLAVIAGCLAVILLRP